MYNVLSSFYLLDTEVRGVIGRSELIELIDNVHNSADNDNHKLGKKYIIEVKEWILDFPYSQGSS